LAHEPIGNVLARLALYSRRAQEERMKQTVIVVLEDAGVLRSIYIRKSAFNGTIPQELTVIISDAKA
jgi:hypothetical protein